MQKYTDDYIMNTVVIHPILSLSMQAIRVYREGKNRLVDICFEDGNIVKGKRVDCFLRGKIAHPTIPSSERFRFKDRVGEEGIANNGLRMTIIKYNSAKDISVRFEDGVVAHNKTYEGFLKGCIEHPTIKTPRKDRVRIVDRTGESRLNNAGETITIVKYRSCEDIDVQFEDGTVLEHQHYRGFKLGTIHKIQINKSRLPHYYKLGETNINKNGIGMQIIKYRNAGDIDIQFENGKITKHRSYSDFRIGKIKCPCDEKKVYNTNVGLECNINKYNGSHDVDIAFEDCTIVKHKVMWVVRKGSVAHPKYSKCEHVATFNNEKIFLCTCKKCKGKHTLKLSEMKDFECTIGR